MLTEVIESTMTCVEARSKQFVIENVELAMSEATAAMVNIVGEKSKWRNIA